MTFSDVRIGDIISLGQFPYKPMRVIHKDSEGLMLETWQDHLQAKKRFALDEFTDAKYAQCGPQPRA